MGIKLCDSSKQSRLTFSQPERHPRRVGRDLYPLSVAGV